MDYFFTFRLLFFFLKINKPYYKYTKNSKIKNKSKNNLYLKHSSAMNRFFATHKHSLNFEYSKGVNNIEI